jgi:hypothetical protein
VAVPPPVFVTVAVPPRHGLPIVVLPETAIVVLDSGGAMLTVAVPAPGWLQPVLDTLVRL